MKLLPPSSDKTMEAVGSSEKSLPFYPDKHGVTFQKAIIFVVSPVIT
jgi:hypothetical protein